MVDFAVKELSSDLDFSKIECWDVVIIGGGPSGLAASLTTAHRGLTTLVIEAKEEAGGQPQFFYPEKKIVDIPGYPEGVLGADLSEKMFLQAKGALVQFRFNEELRTIEDTEDHVKGDLIKNVITSKGEYRARKVILSMGLLHHQRKLAVLERIESKMVYYKMPKIKDFEKKNVVVVGGGDSALDAALMAAERNAQVTLIIRGERSRGKQSSYTQIAQSNVRILLNTEIKDAQLIDNEIELTLTNNDTISAHCIIVQIGYLSAKDLFKNLNVTTKSDGSIAIDSYFETSRKGIFAVGDIHGDIKLITVAWAEGIQAAIYAFKEITSPYWINEKRLRDQRIAIMGAKIAEAAGQPRK
jgi:thioredoxin reductase (NADPH)